MVAHALQPVDVKLADTLHTQVSCPRRHLHHSLVEMSLRACPTHTTLIIIIITLSSFFLSSPLHQGLRFEIEIFGRRLTLWEYDNNLILQLHSSFTSTTSTHLMSHRYNASRNTFFLLLTSTQRVFVYCSNFITSFLFAVLPLITNRNQLRSLSWRGEGKGHAFPRSCGRPQDVEQPVLLCLPPKVCLTMSCSTQHTPHAASSSSSSASSFPHQER